ncbi:complex I assembly factor ACAD9, mitochondrial [Caerostris darwini]|uniref:Complex I assembly factor ACAD9, mitochondrial n=1 Tax=Caerostris darwini TaxID=1538125 RepID=A0AAV4U9I7_9ARAC|nr:complex I assembly factor ACAD9, mitochondrial [Caerostris darwini]
MSTTAKKTPDGNFIIDGTKSWVTNAGIAGLFIVYTKTPGIMDPRETEITAFLVEKNTKGVSVTLHDKLCLRGAQTGIVRFDNVFVPSSNLIGNVGQGFEIYLKSLESFRVAMYSCTFGAMKSFLDSATELIIHRERLDRSLADFPLVRRRLSKICTRIYSMESASYFTAAILDSTEKPDVALESAALKIFNSTGTLYCLQQLIEAVGSSSLMPGSHLLKFYRDALGLAMFDSPNDITLQYLGLQGCKYAGNKEVENIKKLRNPFYYPSHIMKENIRQLRIRWGLLKFEQDIAGHIHPSLVQVVDAQIDPRKLANIATELYVWSAVLSRCSRSYCWGHRNCHHELRLAGAFCHDSYKKIGLNFNDIALGMAKNNERSHLFGGEQVLDCRGYFPEHPLKHNY